MENDWKALRDRYLKERIEDQFKWYERKSASNKRWFHRLRTTVIVSGALIPLLVGYANGSLEWLKYIAGALGAVVAISEGILSLRRYRDLWSTYRLAAERLNRERWLYENNAIEEYASNDEAAFRRFVQRAEQIMASENDEWKSYLQQIPTSNSNK
ncbi:MAG: DUF4231 domain-containing protein [Saprospiraceae bacterium]|nr:DUF4231 domain-containing protein [Saprospiraceae bacterium]MDW8230349.1 DUF4231 domain-containing protein [Saprospiraceae bacterium]